MANGLFRGLLAGALVGATAALLLAPNKGVLTRRSPKEKGTEDIDALREKVAALIALHPTPTPTPIPIPPRDLVFDQPVAISGSAGITGWRSSAVVDGQGTVHVVWISTPTPSSIMYISKPAGGVWSQPFNLSGATLEVRPKSNMTQANPIYWAGE